MEFLQERKDLFWIKALDVVIRTITAILLKITYHDDTHVRPELTQLLNQLGTGNITDARVQHNAVDVRELTQRLNRLRAAVSRDDVEFCALDHEFAGRDACWVFFIDDEEAWSQHY